MALSSGEIHKLPLVEIMPKPKNVQILFLNISPTSFFSLFWLILFTKPHMKFQLILNSRNKHLIS